MLQKVVYLYEYMDNWENFNETSLAEKEYFSSHLNMEDITDADYAHTKRVCKDFESNKRFRRIRWFVCPNGYIIVCWYIWKL